MIEVLEVLCSTCKNRETDSCNSRICVKCVLYGIPDETCVGVDGCRRNAALEYRNCRGYIKNIGEWEE